MFLPHVEMHMTSLYVFEFSYKKKSLSNKCNYDQTQSSYTELNFELLEMPLVNALVFSYFSLF